MTDGEAFEKAMAERDEARTRLAEAEVLLRRWLNLIAPGSQVSVDTATFLAGGDPDA